MRKSNATSGRNAFIALAISALASCDDGHTAPQLHDPQFPSDAGFIEVTPELLTLALAGDSAQLYAVVRDSRGRRIENVAVQWHTAKPSIVTVNAHGRVTGLDRGVSVVRGSYGSLSDSALVVVVDTRLPKKPVRVQIRPHSDTIPAVGGSVRLQATGTDADGQPIANPEVSWFTLDHTVAKVAGDGLVTGTAKGTARVVITDGTSTDTALVYVNPTIPVAAVEMWPEIDTIFTLPGTLRLSPVAVDATGNLVPGETITMSSLDAGVATVDANALVTALAQGEARIVATHGRKQKISTVRVVRTPGTWRVSITPQIDTIPTVGGTIQLQGEASSDSGEPVVPTGGLTWASLHPHAVITGPGKVSGIRSGFAWITAKYRNGMDTAVVYIAPAPPQTKPVELEITPANATIDSVGGSLRLAAVVLDQEGSPISGQTFAWTSLDDDVSVSSTGLVTGKKRGTGRVAATSGSLADTATVEVEPVPIPARVRVRPDPDTIPDIGGTTTLTVEVLDRDGQLIPDATATWSALDGRISVTGDGTPMQSTVVSGLAEGVGRVIAVSGTLVDTGDVVVIGASTPPLEPSRVRVSPLTDTIPSIGGTAQLSAEVLDEADNVVGGLTIAWSSLDPSIATPGTTGLVTGHAAGSARIRASYGTLADTARVTVLRSAPAVTWNISHSPTAPVAGTTVSISASASDPKAIRTTTIRLNADTVKTCAGGSCSYASTFSAGTYAYSVSAVDTAEVALSAGSGSFTVTPSTLSTQRLLAFPGAEGFGANALRACRSLPLQVLAVTSTADNGPGSFRAALAAARPDHFTIVKFDVGGYIAVAGRIISETQSRRCLYVAGQTAPGDGVSIGAPDGLFNGILLDGSNSEDQVWRHLRLRLGANEGTKGIAILEMRNAIFDHLSISWGGEKALIVSPTLPDSTVDVTISRSIFAETSALHPTAMQVTGQNRDRPSNSRIALLRNYFTGNSYRNPVLAARRVLMQNNLVYNWNFAATKGPGSDAISEADVIGNYYRAGPMTKPQFLHAVVVECTRQNNANPAYPDISLHVSGNVGPTNSDPAAGHAEQTIGPNRVTACYYRTGGVGGEPVPDSYQAWRSSRLPLPAVAPLELSADWVPGDVLHDVGSNAGLSCRGDWYRRADSVDRRLVDEYHQGGGVSKPPLSGADVGGFPILAGGSPCADSDGDGLPDAWEARYPAAANPAHDTDGDGYLNIEEYLNGTDPTSPN